MTSFADVADAIADQIEDTLGTAVPGLQVTGLMNLTPSPPCIDVYPFDPFMEQTAFSLNSQLVTFVVRARVSTADTDAGQGLLLEMMDPRSAVSVAAAVEADRSLSGKVAQVKCGAPSGFQIFADASGSGGANLIGVQWPARVVL